MHVGSTVFLSIMKLLTQVFCTGIKQGADSFLLVAVVRVFRQLGHKLVTVLYHDASVETEEDRTSVRSTKKMRSVRRIWKLKVNLSRWQCGAGRLWVGYPLVDDDLDTTEMFSSTASASRRLKEARAATGVLLDLLHDHLVGHAFIPRARM